MEHSISAFFPAYNDEKTIEKLVLTAISTLKQITKDYEVIIVDDGGPDRSGEIADDLSRKFKEVRVIHHKHNKGYGGALKSGFKNAKKELVFYTDGDGQYDVRELKKLLPFIKEADVVNGYKINRSDSIHRKILGGLWNLGVRILFNLKVKDVDCDFRLIKRKIFSKIRLESDSGFLPVEMMIKIQRAGFKIKNIPVHHYPRTEGDSQFFKISRIIEVFGDLIKEWVKTYIKR